MESPTPFVVDLEFLHFHGGLDFNLSNRPIEILVWNKYDKNWITIIMFTCKFILFDDGVLIIFFTIDKQTKKVFNLTVNNNNMKVLGTFICLNLYINFKDLECPTPFVLFITRVFI